jgi:hypothetical protein
MLVRFEVRVSGLTASSEAGRRQSEHAGEHEKHIAPAHQVAEHAAGGLAEKLAENLARQVARQDRLQAIVRRDVADIGHRDRDHPAGRRAGRQPRQRELRQRGGHAAHRHQTGADGAHHGNGAVFAEAVADRADHELDGAVGYGIGGDHHGGCTDAGMEVGCDLRQERIGDADLRLTGEAGDREQNDRAGRRSVRGGRLFGIQHVGMRSVSDGPGRHRR